MLVFLAQDGWRPVYPRYSDVLLVGAAICLLGNAVLVVASVIFGRRLWRRRAPTAQAEAERWDAFRRYLPTSHVCEAPPATLELWERYLVYGIAFGIAERVLQGAQLHMPEAVHEASSIYWISSSGDLGSGATSLSIGDLAPGSAALAPRTRDRWRRRRLLGRGGGGGGGGGGFG